jgi:hypothetical protein
MATKSKNVTNDKAIKNLMKDLHMLEVGLLRERLLKMSELTRNSINNDPEAWVNPIFHPQLFIDLCDKIDKHLSFND